MCAFGVLGLSCEAPAQDEELVAHKTKKFTTKNMCNNHLCQNKTRCWPRKFNRKPFRSLCWCECPLLKFMRRQIGWWLRGTLMLDKVPMIENLQATLERISLSRVVVQSNRDCQKRTVCQGCRGYMIHGSPRMAWNPRTFNVDQLGQMPRYSKGNWHVGCAILMSKVPSRRNCLREVDPRVVGGLTGASPASLSKKCVSASLG